MPQVVEYAGYLSNATVFLDGNINFTLDQGEASSTSDGNGQFTLGTGQGEFQAQGGIDTSTGLAQPGLLVGPAGAAVLSPLTAVIQVVSAVYMIDPADANDHVVAALGLTPGTDLTQLDALAGAKAGQGTATRVLADQVHSGNLIALVNAAGGSFVTQQAAFQNIGMSYYNGTVQNSDVGFVTQLGVDGGLDPATAAAYGQIGAAANQLIDAAVATNSSAEQKVATIEAVAKIVAGAAASALHAAVGNQTALDNAVAAYTGSNLANAVTALVQAPPSVAASADAPTVEATSPAGAVATFTAAARDLVDGSTPVTFVEQLSGGSTSPVQSGDTFAVGTHTILASATDSRGLVGSTSFSFTVTAPVQQGVAQDGYIAGATVFADTNGNGVLDMGEASAMTGANGNFTLTGGFGPLVLVGGADITTGLAFTGKLQAPAGSSVVSPLTTIVQAVAQSQGISVSDANASVVASLGLAPGTDLTTLDAQAGAAAGNATATSVFAAQTQVANAFSLIQAAGGGLASQGANNAIAAAFTSPSTNVLTNAASLATLAANLGVGNANATAVGNVASATNTLVAQAAATGASPTQIVADIAAVATVAQGSASADLSLAVNDPSKLAAVTNSYSGANLANAVAAASAAANAPSAPPPVVYRQDPSLFGTITTDPGSVGGQVYALYQTILGRAPDPRGFEINVAAIKAGASLADIAQNLLGSGEYAGKYGASVASDSGFVNQLYQNGLHRQADPGGLQTYDNALAGGTSRAQVAVAITTSQESRNNLAATFQAGVFVPDESDSAVARLFYGLLGRAPDAGGLQANEAAYAAGASLGQLAQGFLGSVEYQGTVAGQSNLNYIQGLYRTALGRTGDAAGLQTYEIGLDTGSLSRADVANAFFGSAEFQNDEAGQSNASYIDAVYQAALGRHVDADGLQFWQSRLDAGASRVAVARGVVGSAEFSANVIGAGQRAFITSLYEGALGRDPAASETQFWQGVLNSGASQAAVATSISQSPEAIGRLVPKIEAGYHVA